MTLREVIAQFWGEQKAIAHFNFSDSNQLQAIADAAKEVKLPVIVGLSEGEREYFHISQARAAIDDFNAQGATIFLNADHTYSVDKVKRAITAGVDSVVVDGAKLSFDDNLRMLATCVKYARASGRDIIVEGELGYIGQSSKPLDELPEGVVLENLTDPKEAALLIKESGADCLAPAVGNVHGMFPHGKEPKLHPDRVREISNATKVPLVLHGASGNSESEIIECIEAGVAVVHINTELRVLYRKELEESLKEHPKEMTPYKILQPVHDEMKQYVAEKMRLFARQ